MRSVFWIRALIVVWTIGPCIQTGGPEIPF